MARGRKPSLTARRRVECVSSISVLDFVRKGVLRECPVTASTVINGRALTARFEPAPESLTIVVEDQGGVTERHLLPLDRTPCNYGGERTWFRCPNCMGRYAILYQADEGYACRRCLGLAYRSQQESPGNRMMSRAQKIRRQLGGTSDLSLPFPAKPNGMWTITYFRLRATSEDLALRGLCAWRSKQRADCPAALASTY
jgi:hypothetical protein